MQVTGAEVVASRGLFDDGWCEPLAMLRMRADHALTHLALQVWLKPEEGMPAEVGFSVQVDTDEPFACTIEPGHPTHIRVACRRPAERPFLVAVRCDNRVAEAGGDERELSFILNTCALS